MFSSGEIQDWARDEIVLEIVADDKEEKVKNGNVGIAMDETHKEQFPNKEGTNIANNLDVEAQKERGGGAFLNSSMGKEEETTEIEEVLDAKNEHIETKCGNGRCAYAKQRNQRTGSGRKQRKACGRCWKQRRTYFKWQQ